MVYEEGSLKSCKVYLVRERESHLLKEWEDFQKLFFAHSLCDKGRVDSPVPSLDDRLRTEIKDRSQVLL